eukprot:CAMPEP_0116873238 /NCGR_PEP_ID=MMETSP0463-20121206/4257_1 /TAXON_ID=181622 /ORGANISM="Strombidinopsis sp, Strain SopsisLIS2011" /LENGTH=34 /DNA_ID= /DNA_START= /DNA_END= /DNA_ORIENTATION=
MKNKEIEYKNADFMPIYFKHYIDSYIIMKTLPTI